MNLVKTIACIAAAFILAFDGYGKEALPTVKTYLDAMRQLGTNCRMSYSAICTGPDKSVTNVSGSLAISGGNYYDSSNVRFVLMNASWLIMAEHQSRMLNIIYLPAWKKKMGRNIDLDISGYLLNTEDMANFSGFKVLSDGADSFLVKVNYRPGQGQVIDLTLHYAKGALIPARYEGMVTYVLDEETEGSVDDPPALMNVRFECHGINPVVDAGLFSDERLIRVKGGKAELKRYNNYKYNHQSA